VKRLSVLVMHKDSFLINALASLLVSGFELNVVAGEAMDYQSLSSEISRHRSELILMGQSMPVAAAGPLICLLREFPGLRVIVISEDSNWLHIYRQDDVLLTKAVDIVQVINSA
jgi:DNA-binding NarL/FixJ family response regulator